MRHFNTQQECWEYVASGSSMFLMDNDRTEIKFVNGSLKAFIGEEWVPCPVTFEEPRLFSC